VYTCVLSYALINSQQKYSNAQNVLIAVTSESMMTYQIWLVFIPFLRMQSGMWDIIH
jgi:hypothetical protein